MNKLIVSGITNIGDPFVLTSGGKYYMYATSFATGFYVWESEDLLNWENRGLCYEKSSRSFGYKDFWAPEVVEINGKFIMHYSARSETLKSLRIGVATSNSPLGPFKDVFPGKPMFDFGYAAIDGHVFIDDDKKAWFYYSKDCSENIINNISVSEIYVVELWQDLLSVKGVPALILTPDQEWETSSSRCRWNEGPFVYKENGKYFLTYSANCYDSRLYAVGVATADSPKGPFIKYAGNPVLKYKENFMSGPGHNCLFRDKNGGLKAAFHIHTDYDNPSGDRRACFCGVKVKNGAIEFEV